MRKFIKRGYVEFRQAYTFEPRFRSSTTSKQATSHFFFLNAPIRFPQTPFPSLSPGVLDVLGAFLGGNVSLFCIAGWPKMLSSMWKPHFMGFFSPLRRARPLTFPLVLFSKRVLSQRSAWFSHCWDCWAKWC
jgi:hypothetical protein